MQELEPTLREAAMIFIHVYGVLSLFNIAYCLIDITSLVNDRFFMHLPLFCDDPNLCGYWWEIMLST